MTSANKDILLDHLANVISDCGRLLHENDDKVMLAKEIMIVFENTDNISECAKLGKVKLLNLANL